MRELVFCKTCGHRDFYHGDRAVIHCAYDKIRSGPPDYISVPCDCKEYVV